MLNGLWLNAQELNGTGATLHEVALAATASTAIVTDTASAIQRRGLKSTVTGGATAVNAVQPWRAIRATTSTSTTAINASSVRRTMGSEVAVFTDSLLGSSLTVLLGASVTAGATGILLPYDALFDADVSAGATVDTATMLRIRKLASSVSLATTAGSAAAVHVDRILGSVVNVTAVATASQDTMVGGVRYAEFGSEAAAGATAQTTIDPKKNLFASVSTDSSGIIVGPVVLRYRFLGSPPVQALALAAPIALNSRVSMSAPAVTGGATSLVALLRLATFAPAAASVTATVPTFRLGAVRPMGFDVAISVTAPTAPAIRRVGLAALSAPLVSATAAPKLAERLGGLGFAGANAVAAVSKFTIHQLSGTATVDITANNPLLARLSKIAGAVNVVISAEATPLINLFSLEPDYRTLVVDAEDFTLQVDTEEFVLYVTDDSATMKTFSKQPHDVLGYDIDLTQWFAALPGDEIDSAVAVVSEGPTTGSDLTVGAVVMIGSPAYIVKVWLSKGISGTTYKVTVTITTEDGRTKEIDFKMKVKEL